jgi:hypothetical protein
METIQDNATNQINQQLQWHHLIHLGEKHLPFGLLFGRALLVITKTKLFAAHQTSPSQRSEHYSRKVWAGFPESP